ncbi:MAG: M24 family metallopeptidase, partial [Candidatus Levybacteria bacterium]|nr:M24 family metallopeptidase [Candidatus Levybacteria bacterium]
VGFGKNSAVPHHQATNNKLTNNEIVLLDFGVKLDNYCSDMTRTVFFGKASAEFKKMYETVLKAQSKAIEFLNTKYLIHNTSKQKIIASDIDNIARKHIISSGYKTIPHSLGHGIGLEVHEKPSLSPKSKDILKKGMVFSIEPGIYIPNFGGVRIEDLVVLEKGKLRLLTHSPKNFIEL